MTSNSFVSQPGYKARSTNWTSVRLLNVYRLAISTMFFSQSFVQQSPLLNIVEIGLYSWVSLAFVILSLLWMLAAWIERRGFQHQVSLQIYSDMIVIILLMHACGGISSGIGMLLIISIVMAGLLVEQLLSMIFASLASLGLLAEYVYSVTNIENFADNSTQVGILGATLLATAVVTHKLMLRVQSSEQLVQQRERDVALLSALNQEIIENMQAGVIVLTRNNQVRHINNAALKMLNIATNKVFSLKHNHPEILSALKKWRDSPDQDTPFLPTETGIDNIQVSFRHLEDQGNENTLIFLNDVSSIKDSMQQAKLASLGHLTASIAHEIRNPLGAISHAAQLLSENQELAESDQRMTEIIHQHSNRINHIIEDILKLSRGSQTTKEAINLGQWLKKFLQDYCLSNQDTKDGFDLNIQLDKAIIRFDAGHLNQIMTNLCTNARIHGDKEKPVQIRLFKDSDHAVNLEIADQGPGIPQQDLDKIFEPFYTTNHQGSGLGLYIVSQLCDLNDAGISIGKNSCGGASFIIHPVVIQASQEAM